MMQKIPCSVDLGKIRSEVLGFELERVPDGAGDEGWITGLSMRSLYFPLPYSLTLAVMDLRTAVRRSTVKRVLINRIDAKRGLRTHRDGPPAHLRYHLPVITSPDVIWWDEVEGSQYMEAGSWWGPVNYCGILHSMTNMGTEPRYHVVVDLQ